MDPATFQRRPFPLPEAVTEQEAGGGARVRKAPPTYNDGDEAECGKPNVHLHALGLDKLMRQAGGDYVTLSARWPPGCPDLSQLQPSDLTGAAAEQLEVLYSLAPQGSALWHAARQGKVTASVLGAYLGFSELTSARELGMPRYLTGHEQLDAIQRSLQRADGTAHHAENPALQWGHLHEPNCLWQVLENVRAIPGFEWVRDRMVLETGFISLPPCEDMPRLGASPDGLLLAWPGPRAMGGQPVKVALEFKSRFPFKKEPELDENGDAVYRYAPLKRFPALMLPTHYAQVQLSMLACGANTCLYMEYTVTKTNVRVVQYDAAWVDAAIGEGTVTDVEGEAAEGAAGEGARRGEGGVGGNPFV
ncbi:hypothetical protein GPECTOR_978g246 [Gonium pectorale]|uniref:YqaJ viral recombinase domain-containing protein n=1 Tax=Gonium pectorale TaxID=33097 RepID=A0A150FTS1_GONPE|nr:hypothetical protein GPECTOR_978g246 [Gonium pectorale]|eukprot:KXZ41012.1 hypothetical protein GPECTOR_978g246 [Gonium pectorale]